MSYNDVQPLHDMLYMAQHNTLTVFLPQVDCSNIVLSARQIVKDNGLDKGTLLLLLFLGGVVVRKAYFCSDNGNTRKGGGAGASRWRRQGGHYC